MFGGFLNKMQAEMDAVAQGIKDEPPSSEDAAANSSTPAHEPAPAPAVARATAIARAPAPAPETVTTDADAHGLAGAQDIFGSLASKASTLGGNLGVGGLGKLGGLSSGMGLTGGIGSLGSGLSGGFKGFGSKIQRMTRTLI